MKQLAFYIDSSACIGCKTCELACKDEKNLAMGVRIRKVREYGGGGWIERDGYMIPDTVFTNFVSASCMHCAQPACRDVCPTAAISKDKDTGIVLINKAACIGCGTCADACPYGAPSLNEKEEKMYKCDMCFDRVKAGQEPVCVGACLQRVIKAGELAALRKQYGRINSVAPLASGDQTDPSVVFTPADNPGRLMNARLRNVTEV